MTYNEVFRKGADIIRQAGCESPAFDALCIFEKCFSLDRTGLSLHGDETADESKTEEFISLVRQRAQHRPLQYILGEWEFMGLPFTVGEGVLIPRPETELLAETALNYMKKISSPLVLDLCGGSGCIGISVSVLNPNSKVFIIEKSDEALKYLKINRKRYGAADVNILYGDINDGFEKFGIPQPDVLLSNPPYVLTEELKTLQSEVKKEPREALDGGADGLKFYRAISEKWLPYLKCGGLAAVECGIDQADDIKNIFSGKLNRIEIKKDLSGIERIVCGEK